MGMIERVDELLGQYIFLHLYLYNTFQQVTKNIKPCHTRNVQHHPTNIAIWYVDINLWAKTGKQFKYVDEFSCCLNELTTNRWSKWMLDLLTDKRQTNAPEIVYVPPTKYLDPTPHRMKVLEERRDKSFNVKTPIFEKKKCYSRPI